jgi:glyoxylase-like metal-dependent hydrolase (beta-lactamase superfamily II)
MLNYICKTCGVQFAASQATPAHCPICEDERQYIGWKGQQWTTLSELRENHHNIIKTLEPDLTGIGTKPGFAIGQRALLVATPEGNLLWDCISLIDGETIAALDALGGVRGIAISHPHFYDSMIEWSRAFDAPIHLHIDNKHWVMRPDAVIQYWGSESKELWSGLTLIRCGGHFEGSSVLHWPAGAGGKGALLTGDTLQVVSDRRYVSFMRSYPNLIPLPASKVQAIAEAVRPYQFDRIYGGWWDRVVRQDAHAAVRRSADRYIKAIQSPQ